jgi:hypothetical protein
LILRDLRGAKAPLVHGTTGIHRFFRSLFSDAVVVSKKLDGLSRWL